MNSSLTDTGEYQCIHCKMVMDPEDAWRFSTVQEDGNVYEGGLCDGCYQKWIVGRLPLVDEAGSEQFYAQLHTHWTLPRGKKMRIK